MEIVGIICEYNPLHLGHAGQIRRIRQTLGGDTAVVCLMSGSFVQRGAPAVYPKSVRAAAALQAGADLVLELPVTYALSSAEGFAMGGVEILSRLCTRLCFGAECGSEDALMSLARGLLSPGFPSALRTFLDQGLSFPAARQQALHALGLDAGLLSSPNNILGVEYCKAILKLGCAMSPLVIHRPGDYHAQTADPCAPSATALRRMVVQGQSIRSYVPTELFQNAPVHTLAAGERAILARLRTMNEEEFSVLPYGGEGLWRKLMHESRRQPDLESILTAVKSKRYTRTRLDRMVMCAFLGIDQQTMSAPAPYARILGFDRRGRELLALTRKSGFFLNVGTRIDHPYWLLEQRCADLYGLFAVDGPEPAGSEPRQRIIYQK